LQKNFTLVKTLLYKGKMVLKISIFDRFIFKQVLKATLVCLLLFIIVWIAPETLVKIIKKIFNNVWTITEGLKYLIYELPKVLGKALPVGILLGSLFTFDKLSKDSELSILRGIGLSFSRIMVPVLVFSLFLAFACFYVSDKLIPYASKATGEGANFNKHFVYLQKDEHQVPTRGIIISNFMTDGIKNLIIINYSNEKYDDAMTFKSIVFAPYALLKDDAWLLPEAKEYKINKDGVYTDINEIKNYKILEGKLSKDVYTMILNSTKKDRFFTTKELKEYKDILKEQDFTDEYNFVLTKYYQRYLHPLTCILFAAIGCLLGFSPPRSQRLIGFTVAVGMIFAYYITLPFFDLMAQKSVIPPFLAAAFPIIAFIISIFFIKKVKDL